MQTGQIFRSAHNEGPIATAADIKKNVPELWVRKMKTFFAFYDKNSDGQPSADSKIYFVLLLAKAGRGRIDRTKF